MTFARAVLLAVFLIGVLGVFSLSQTQAATGTSTVATTAPAASANVHGAAWPYLAASNKDLQQSKRLLMNDARFAKSKSTMITNANANLKQKVPTVMDKPNNQVAPSGDKHDYSTMASYFWPNPNTPDGTPYVHRDGEINPDAVNWGDAKSMTAAHDVITGLANAYYYTGDERYAKRALEVVRAWYIDPKTKMNPSFTYAGYEPGIGYDEDNALAGLGTMDVFDAVALLSQSPSWTAADDAGLREWAKEYLAWLTSPTIAAANHLRTNNIGNWYEKQVIQTNLVLGNKDAAVQEYKNYVLPRLAQQVEGNGRQTYEVTRTKALSYSLFDLSALMDLAELGDRMNITSYWTYTAKNGGSIANAIKFLAPYIDTTQEFPYGTINKVANPSIVMSNIARYLDHVPDPELQQVFNQYYPKNPTSWMYMYPYAGVVDVTSAGAGVAVPPKVSVNATKSLINEDSLGKAAFIILRTGPISQPLAVNFSLSGTANRGIDYVLKDAFGTVINGNSATILNGYGSVTIYVEPVDDKVKEPTEKITLGVPASSSYTTKSPTAASIQIADDDTNPKPVDPNVTVVANQLQTIEHAFQLWAKTTNSPAWPREKAIGISPATISNYVKSPNALGPYLSAAPLAPVSVSKAKYGYDNDGDIFTCGGSVYLGASISLNPVPTNFLTALDNKFDSGDGPKCGKVTWDGNRLFYKLDAYPAYIPPMLVASTSVNKTQGASVFTAIESFLNNLLGWIQEHNPFK